METETKSSLLHKHVGRRWKDNTIAAFIGLGLMIAVLAISMYILATQHTLQSAIS